MPTVDDGLQAAEPELCDGCGHDSSQWNHGDTIRTLEQAAGFVHRWLEDLDPALSNRRVSPDRWSIAEYVDHIGDTFEVNELGIRLSLSASGTTIDDPPTPGEAGPHREIDLENAIERLDAAASRIAELLATLRGDDWQSHLIIDSRRHDVVWASRHLVRDWWHHLVDIADLRRDLGDPVTPQSGTIAQINASDGGVPKRPIAGTDIGPRGLDTDRQATRRHHGRPWQAVCLWSTDVIDLLAAEGHPIGPGDAGENLTIRGIDWSALRAGAIVEVGEATLRLSIDALPCKKIASCFIDREFRRIDHSTYPGTARWYAQVVTPGRVATGDPVRVIG